VLLSLLPLLLSAESLEAATLREVARVLLLCEVLAVGLARRFVATGFVGAAAFVVLRGCEADCFALLLLVLLRGPEE
jgi:hypothetical protein